METLQHGLQLARLDTMQTRLTMEARILLLELISQQIITRTELNIRFRQRVSKIVI